MKTYTVVGYYKDSKIKCIQHQESDCPEHAQSDAERDGVTVVQVFNGELWGLSEDLIVNEIEEVE